MPNGIENGRASFAYERVSAVLTKKYAKEYRALLRAFPVMIQTNGFGASVAFLFSKRKNNQHEAVYNDIAEWLKKQKIIDNDLMTAITQQPRDGYRRMTKETMALLLWMKRFAEGLIEGESSEKQ